MRKSIDTILLVILLIGPSVLLTCMREEEPQDNNTVEMEAIDNTDNEAILYATVDMPRP